MSENHIPDPTKMVPAAWDRGVLAELQDAAERKWQGDPTAQRAGWFARAAEEIKRQQREREVFARWMAEACGVPFSAEEEAEDGGESLRMLRERGLRLVRAVLGPPPIENEPNGPLEASDPLPDVLPLPFAVFDEFGRSADDRVRAYAIVNVAAAQTAERQRFERLVELVQAAVKEANRAAPGDYLLSCSRSWRGWP